MRAKLVAAGLMVVLIGARAQSELPALVSSSTSGDGLFTYTFSRNPYADFVWGFATGGQGLYLQSYGVVEVLSPPGWTSTIDANGQVHWLPTTPAYLVDTLSFGIRSSIVGSTLSG